MRRLAIGVLGAAALACGESERAAPAVAEEPPVASGVSWADAPEVDPVQADVFMREPVGPGRLMMHALVPAGSTREQVRQTMFDLLSRTGAEDTTLVAVRLVVYVAPAGQGREAELTPSAWGEWLPPEGWDGATEASRRAFHRIYTYIGAPPAW